MTAGGDEVRVGLADAWALRLESVPPVRRFASYRGQRHCRALVVGHRWAACRIRVVAGTRSCDGAGLRPGGGRDRTQPFWLFWPAPRAADDIGRTHRTTSFAAAWTDRRWWFRLTSSPRESHSARIRGHRLLKPRDRLGPINPPVAPRKEAPTSQHPSQGTSRHRNLRPVTTHPLSRRVEDCEGCPPLAGARNLGLDDPRPVRPDSHCNFGDRSIRVCRAAASATESPPSPVARALLLEKLAAEPAHNFGVRFTTSRWHSFARAFGSSLLRRLIARCGGRIINHVLLGTFGIGPLT